jgi:hypothetical protein
MPSPATILRPLAAASLLLFVVAASVAGYAGQVAATVTATTDGDGVPCGTAFAVSALVEDAGGDPISEQPVAWSFGLGSVGGDAILDETTTSDGSGIATTRVRLACGEVRQVTLVISADDVEGSVVLSTSGDGLPRTDTTPLAATGTSLPGVLLAALAVLIGSGAILHRFATTRR